MVKFLEDEGGAITTDWVVMTAAVAGLGIASISMMSGGVQGGAEEIADQNSSQLINTTFAQRLASSNFTGGDTGGWSGGQVLERLEGLGEMLVIGPKETITLSLDMPDDSDRAKFEFDLIAADTLDNEIIIVGADGTEITIATAWRDNSMSFEVPDVEGLAVSTETILSGQNLNGRARYDDNPLYQEHVTRVSITMDAPNATLDLSLESGANSGINNESFAIDNVLISAI